MKFTQRLIDNKYLEISCIDNDSQIASLFYYPETRAVGISKYVELSFRQSLHLVFFMRKAIKELGDNIIAYCEASDSQTNRLLGLLRFKLKTRKMNYNMYCNGSSNNSASSRSDRV